MSSEKSKMVLAVIAVALMVGVALVPLTYEPTEASVTTTTTDDSAVELTDLISALKEGLSEGQLDFGNFSLVPVNEEIVGTEVILPTEITKDERIKSGEVCNFKGNYTFGDGSTKNGIVIVEDGGTIVLMPAVADSGFKITNKNTVGLHPENTIVVNNGAKISICGVMFKLFTRGTYGAPLIALFDGQGLDKPRVAEFTSTIENNEHVIGIKVTDDNTHLRLFGAFNFLKGTDFNIRGTQTVEDNTISFTNCTFDIVMCNFTFNYTLKTGDGPKSNFSITISSDVEGDKDTCNIDLTCDLHLKTYKMEKGKTFDKKVTVDATNVGLTFDYLKLTVINEKNGEEIETTYSAKCTGNFTLAADKAIVNAEIKGKKVEITADKFSVTLNNIELNAKTTTVEPTTNARSLTYFDIVGNLAVNADKVSPTEPISISSVITIGSISDLTLNATSFECKHVKTSPPQDAVETSTFKAKSIALYGILDSKGSSLVNRNLLCDLGFKLDVSKFKFEHVNSATADGIDGKNSIEGDFSLVFAISLDGVERDLSITVTGLYYITQNNRSTGGATSVVLKNDIPLTKMSSATDKVSDAVGFKHFLYTDDFLVQLSMSDVSYSHIHSNQKVIEGKGFSFLWNPTYYGISEAFAINVESDFKITLANTQFDNTFVFSYNATLEGKVISGYVKNINEAAESFTITGSTTDASVTFSLDVISIIGDLGFTMEIDSGDAVFGKGLLPLKLYVGKNVSSFKASGLSALSMYFANDMSKNSGTITYDLADKIKMPRLIEIGNKALECNLYDDDNGCYPDMGGYVLTYDLASKNGKMVAYDGWTINDAPASEWTVDDTRKTATFAFDGSSDLKLKKVTSSEFKFSYEDKPTEIETKTYGKEIELKDYQGTVPEGKVFVGWSDGEKTYAAGSTYTMPAKTVVMKAVFADAVEATPGEIIVVKSDSSKSVAVKAGELGGGEKNVVFEVSGMSVTMDKDTVKKITEGMEDESYLFLSANKVTDIIDATKKKVVGDNDLYEINLFKQESTGTTTPVYGNTSFQVTLKVNCDSDKYLKSIGVQYLDDGNHVSEVAVENITRNSDGTYNVTFTVSHFSDFILSPEFGSNPSPAPKDDSKTYPVALVLVLVVIVALLALAARYIARH